MEFPDSSRSVVTMTATVAAPRPKSLSRAALVAVTLVGAAAGVFGLSVWTPAGQRIDQWFLEVCRSLPPVTELPIALDVEAVTSPLLWIGVAIAVIVLSQCRRFGSRRAARRGVASTLTLLAFAPLAVLGARFLRDHVLTRPQLHAWISETANSAPSGHAAAATAIVVVLALATPPIVRPITLAIVGTWAAVIEFQLVASGWHRPSDVVISTLLVIGLGVLLPDPWQFASRRVPRFCSAIAAFAIVVAVPTIVALHYPTITQIAAAGAIAAIMAVAVIALSLNPLRSAQRARMSETVAAESAPSLDYADRI
jgi:membrane-associated phospholipid phosphatase